MSSVISIFEKELSKDERHNLAKSLHDSYESFMQDYRVWHIIDTLIPESLRKQLQPLKENVIGHKIVNDLILKYYPCERVVKYHLSRQFLKKKLDVTIFEMNIDNSRLDLGRINGNSYGYEIKTELDQLSKLSKQLNDYSKAIEFIYVVTPEKHHSKVLDMVPDFCGVMFYELHGGRISIKESKPALISPNLNPEVQINNLASKDLEYILKNLGEKRIPSTRKEREDILFKLISNIDFNELFKLAIKNKFRSRWEYLRSIFSDIQPIDAQAFFAMPADPYWVYYKNSSMV